MIWFASAMIWFVSIVFGIAAIVTAFFHPVLAWGVLALPLGWILLMWLALRSKRVRPLPELSSAANELLRKFGHYYAHPFAGAAYSGAASGVTMASMAVAAIGAFKGFWWGLGVGAVFYVISAFLARQFNPANFLVDDLERAAHDELVTAIQRRHSCGGTA